MNVQHMQRAYAPDHPLRASRWRGHRALEARWAREEIADEYATDRAIRAWAREHGLDPLRLGVAWSADYSRENGTLGRDDAGSVRIDALYILDGATRAEADAVHAAWSSAGVDALWQGGECVAW